MLRLSSAQDRSIVLIGMPGAGKSTIGALLAKRACLGFVDTDVLIQCAEGRPLQDIVDRDGYAALRRIEEQVIMEQDCSQCVIATGGSAVYSERAMQRLKRSGIVIFLDVDLPVLEERVHDLATRGLARRPEQSFSDLFTERRSLYLRYADITIACGRLGHDEVCSRILEAVEGRAASSGPAACPA